MQHWKLEFPWVEHDPIADVMYCRVCRLYPTISDPNSTLIKGTGTGGKYRKDTLSNHDTCKLHGFCILRKANDKAPQDAPLKKLVTKLSADNEGTMNVLFKATNHIARTKQSFKQFPQLVELLEDCGVDVGGMYRSDKMCKDLVKSIASVEEACVIDQVKEACFLTVLADGSTDCTVVEQESVYVRYVAADGSPKTKLAKLVALESGNAEGVLQGIPISTEVHWLWTLRFYDIN